MSALGDFIKKKRTEKGITQKDLAIYLGFSNVFMGMIEKGKSGMPVEYTHKLAKRLGVTAEEVFKLIKKDVDERLRMKMREQ
jgi:transcriptional regulator with XRE-family HTH domain